ncbi:MAG: choice-of-anchor D domain-containing protein [Acidobacteriota bacterium]
MSTRSQAAVASLRRLSLALALTVIATACGGGSSTPTSPTPSNTTPTRIVGVSGNLAFGDVAVGSSRDLSFTIANTGTAVLTVSGLSISGGLAAITSASWTSGTIAAGGSQSVSVRFSPTAAGSFSGTLAVNGDQTSGSNTIAVTASASATFTGTWSGAHTITQCNGTGSVQDLICGAARGAYKVGAGLTFSVTLTQSGNTVAGTANLGGPTGPVTGTVAGSTVTLTGTLRDNQGFTSVITSWNTSISGNAMTGNLAYSLTFNGVPGNAGIVADLSGVTRQ